MLLKSAVAIMSLQICLDRAGYSPNAIDGAWGGKSQSALATYCTVNEIEVPRSEEVRRKPEAVFERIFPGTTNLFVRVAVTEADAARTHG